MIVAKMSQNKLKTKKYWRTKMCFVRLVCINFEVL